MMGTPDLRRVCICRQNNIVSVSSTFGAPMRRFQPSAAAAEVSACAVCLIVIGVMPVLKSWSATVLLEGPSSTPLISSPRLLRPS